MGEVRALPYDEAIARIVALHVGLARARENCIAAIEALDMIVEEEVHDAIPTPEDSMSITELANAIGVRSSALRFWEREGLVNLERIAGATRLYPLASIREARIVAALRAGGYRIPAVHAVMESLRTVSGAGDARTALQNRLHTVASQSEALIRAGADIADIIRR